MNKPEDSNVRAVQDLLARRAAIGLTKYGVTTERTDLTTLDFMAHLQEELLDAAVYLQRLIADEEAKAGSRDATAAPEGISGPGLP